MAAVLLSAMAAESSGSLRTASISRTSPPAMENAAAIAWKYQVTLMFPFSVSDEVKTS